MFNSIELSPRLGLGSDCSAGYAPSVLENMRFAVATSNQVHIGRRDEGLDYREVHVAGINIFVDAMPFSIKMRLSQ